MTNDVVIYATGFIYCSVCAPADMSVEDVVARVNEKMPTGIKSDWVLCDEDFATGEINPCQCEDDETRLHYLLNC